MPSPVKTANVQGYRASSVPVTDSGQPASLNEAARTVDCIIATETPIRSYSYNFDGSFDELLVVSGVVIPPSGQVPLLDTHSRYATYHILGSTRNIRVEGNTVIGTDHFSSVDDAQDPWTKTKEGHLTDRSAGFHYKVSDTVQIAAGQTGVVGGRTYTADANVPLVVVERWTLKENSLCAIGADAGAKTRSDNQGGPDEADPTKNKGQRNMNPELKAYLVTRGLAPEASDEQAEAFALTLRVEPAVPAGVTEPVAPAASATGQRADGVVIVGAADTNAAIALAISTERSRVGSITDMCTQFGITDATRSEMITGEVTVDAAREQIMAAILKRDTGADNVGFRAAEVGTAAADKYLDAAGDALTMRAGVSLEKPADGASDLRGFSMVEMARECLKLSGERSIADPMRMVARALTTSDLPLLLGNVANKTLQQAFETQVVTWQEWCGIGSVSDFKEYTEVGVSSGGLLSVIKERGEYEFDSLKDESSKFSIQTLGKMFAFSRQMLINDDLNALAKIGRIAGESAMRTLNRLAYMVLINNAAMADGNDLFSAAHGNLGTGGIIATATLDEAKRKMQLQRGIDGEERLNIRGQFILAPTGSETLAEDFFSNTVYDGTDKAATRKNRYNGTTLKRVYDAELDGTDDDQTAWYMAGAKGQTINMNFLNGNQTPFLDSKEGWNQDGIEWKVRLDAGASVVSYKALVKNAGA